MDLSSVISAVTDGEGFAFLSTSELLAAASGTSLTDLRDQLAEQGYLHLPRVVPRTPGRHILVYRAREAVASILMLQQQIEAPDVTEEDRESLAAILALAGRQLAKDVAAGRAARLATSNHRMALPGQPG